MLQCHVSVNKFFFVSKNKKKKKTKLEVVEGEGDEKINEMREKLWLGNGFENKDKRGRNFMVTNF